jgi:hypothetical protein
MTNFLDYTHNLNILIVDENENIIEDKILLESIYNEFDNKLITKQGKILNRMFEIKMYWNRLSLTNIQGKFMGELFIKSLHSDKVLYETTKRFLSEIENKLKINSKNKNWKIIFHMSKLLESNNIVLTLF